MLVLAYNKISSLDGLSELPPHTNTLEHLDMKGNSVRDLADVQRHLCVCERLVDVQFQTAAGSHRNPICELAAYAAT